MLRPRLLNPKLAVLLVLSLVWLPACAETVDFTRVDPADHTYDRWYLDTIEGQPAGYWRSSMQIEEGKLVTAYYEHRVESHGGERSTYTHHVVWTETKDFKPLHIVVTTAAGSDEITKTYRFVNDGVELTSEQNGRSIQRKLPAVKGDYLTAAQTAIATEVLLENAAQSFELNTLDISVGLTPLVTTYTRSQEEPKQLELADGRAAQSSLWVCTFSAFPGFEMEHWVDESHRVVGLAYDIDGMVFESRLADATVAEREFNPPEMSGLSVVVPDRPIKNIHRKRKIVYELHYESGDSDIVPTATARQSVEGIGKGRARVTVDLDAEPQAAKNDRPDASHLASTIMVDHEDEVVRRLAARAVAKLGKDADAEQVAKACKRYVTRHITGASLSVGDGSASEAARTREGDCTESAVLLAALLRANRVPSRCVNGLVYSEDDFVGQKDVFIYHMWTQAWVADGKGGGYWLDLDSAMWRYSAGHIALGVSAMGDEGRQDLIDIVPLQQNLKIKVLESE